MLDVDEWEGVNSLLDNYAEVRDDDTVVVVYTPDSQESAAWVLACLDARGFSVKRVPMLPLSDAGFPGRLQDALPLPSDLPGRLLILTFERDTMSHSEVIRSVLCAYDDSRCVVIRAISASPALFSRTLRISPRELSARNTAILERCMNAKKLRIRAAGGTDLKVTLDNDRYRWISNRGVWRRGTFVMLPAGEVATFPASIEGILVADFAFNANVITDRDARLHDCPVKVWIDDGKATKYECKNPEIMSFLQSCFQISGVDNVGELGFGTNRAVEESIRLNSHINERRPGVHLGFGDHNQQAAVVDYRCHLHIDLISVGGLIWVDDDPVPLDLENIIPSEQPHPTRCRAEDLKSPGFDELDIDDCCGILTRDGLRLFSQPIFGHHGS